MECYIPWRTGVSYLVPSFESRRKIKKQSTQLGFSFCLLGKLVLTINFSKFWQLQTCTLFFCCFVFIAKEHKTILPTAIMKEQLVFRWRTIPTQSDKPSLLHKVEFVVIGKMTYLNTYLKWNKNHISRFFVQNTFI